MPEGWAPRPAKRVTPGLTPSEDERWVAALVLDIPEIDQDPLDFVLTRGLPLALPLALRGAYHWPLYRALGRDE